MEVAMKCEKRYQQSYESVKHQQNEILQYCLMEEGLKSK